MNQALENVDQSFFDDLLEFVRETKIQCVEDEGKFYINIPSHAKFAWGRTNQRYQKMNKADVYEEVTTLVTSFLLNRAKCNVVLDIGAASGFFSFVAASYAGNPVKVHAFEMNPESFISLQKGIKDRGHSDEITAHLMGCSDQHVGKKQIWYSGFNLYEEKPSLSNLRKPLVYFIKAFLSNNKRKKIKQAEIEISSIDHFCENVEVVPDLLKIDVDGYEEKVIKGALNTFKKYHPPIILELHRDRMIPGNITRVDVVKPLFDLGYKALFFTKHNSIDGCEILPVTLNDELFLRQNTDQVLFY